MSKILKNQKGQGLIEYLVLVAFMVVACIGVIRGINHTINTKYQEIDFALRGTEKHIERERVNHTLSKKRSLSDFIRGAGVQRDQ